MKFNLAFLIIVFGAQAPTSAAPAANVSQIGVALILGESRQYTLADIITALSKKGQEVIDLEQGDPKTSNPQFDRFNLDGNDYLDVLQAVLGSRDYAYEMHGSIMLIYDKKQRASGDAYPLNRKISSLKLTNVSLGQCFQELGKQLKITILQSPMIMNVDHGVLPNFDIQLDNITLREALFQIALKSGGQYWDSHLGQMNGKPVVWIGIQ